jgi:hypothetical protein
MARTRWSLLAVLPFSLVAACSSQGAYQLCQELCDAQLACNYINADQNTNCRAVCDANQALYTSQDNALVAACHYTSDIRHQQQSCYSTVACAANEATYNQLVAKCIQTVKDDLCNKP